MSRRRSNENLECKVYVGDLARDVSERDLEKVFKQFGSLRSVWVARNPPGFAFIEFDDERDAADAIKELDGTDVCGARIRVRGGNDYPSRGSRGPPRRGAMSTRRPYDPQDRCYRCNERGHYAYDCDKHGGGSGGGGGGGDHRRGRDASRSPSRERRRSYSRSRSHDRDRRDRRRSRS